MQKGRDSRSEIRPFPQPPGGRSWRAYIYRCLACGHHRLVLVYQQFPPGLDHQPCVLCTWFADGPEEVLTEHLLEPHLTDYGNGPPI